MNDLINKYRFTVKPVSLENSNSLELARSIQVHPLTYQELPYDPEYSNYAGRLTLEKLSNISSEEMYWKARREIIFRHTGEHPFEISGPDALKFLQKIFPRDISKIAVGRCSYQFACYHDGGMITDGILLRIDKDKYWFAQADGDLFSWYKAHSKNFNVEIDDPNVWVSQVQGPLSMKLLENLSNGFSENDWKYFDWKELQILDQKVIVSRSGFTNELGWEIYFRPENETEKIGDYILEQGKKLGMILVATPGFRCRRIEAGLLSAGQDFSKNTNPFSVGLGRFINFDKENFIGKEALMSSEKKCKTWGIRVMSGTAIKGESIKLNEEEIGKITSSTWSPYQVCGVGIVHLNNNENGPGDIVDVKCTDGKLHKGQICKLPMYDENGEIVRGIDRNIPHEPKPWPGI
jgi:glycine cleavage system aminomethyltransferase T